jgi:GTP-binding protein
VQQPSSRSRKKGSKATTTPPLTIRFIKSAVNPPDYPPAGPPEVAIVGRSNAGKSSLINAIYWTRAAKVSSTPGKTRLINFFDVNGKYRLIDLPGYGYAARSESERISWRSSIESYLSLRATLAGFILVVDVRRNWQLEEADLIDWLHPRGLPWVLVLTKSDKLTRNEINQRKAAITREIENSGVTPPAKIFVSSAPKREGVAEIEDFFFKSWVMSKKGKKKVAKQDNFRLSDTYPEDDHQEDES